jgi:hypothetical protein
VTVRGLGGAGLWKGVQGCDVCWQQGSNERATQPKLELLGHVFPGTDTVSWGAGGGNGIQGVVSWCNVLCSALHAYILVIGALCTFDV